VNVGQGAGDVGHGVEEVVERVFVGKEAARRLGFAGDNVAANLAGEAGAVERRTAGEFAGIL
jgi:hypothetical protein